jgi:hypothetical protein
MASTVFNRSDTFPDFTDCAGTTPEPNGNWKAVIVHGGPSRGLSQIMPAFGDLLTDEEINDVIAYMRGFCKNSHHFPLGELNLPRALVTEKAFPENEVVISTAASVSGAPAWTTDVIDERTIIDARTQLETDVPVNYADQAHNWTAGFGDITLALKREMFSSLRTGSILSLQGGILLPTGDSMRGFGAGTTQFEPFAAFDQLFKENTFLQTQLGADLPVDTSVAPRSMFWRVAIGQAMAPDHMLGRLFSPMVEFLAVRDFKPGATTDWDILPEMQITISRRQHVRTGFGVRERRRCCSICSGIGRMGSYGMGGDETPLGQCGCSSARGGRGSGNAARQVADGEREGRQDASGYFFSNIGPVYGLS